MKKLEYESSLIGLKEVGLLLEITCEMLLPEIISTYDKDALEKLETALNLTRNHFQLKYQEISDLFYEEF